MAIVTFQNMESVQPGLDATDVYIGIVLFVLLLGVGTALWWMSDGYS